MGPRLLLQGSVRGVIARSTGDRPVATGWVSLKVGGTWGLASHHPITAGSYSDTTSDRGSGQTWLDKVSPVSTPLAQQLLDPLLGSGEC